MVEKILNLYTILALVIGILFGIGIYYILAYFRNKNVENKAEKIIKEAKIETEKAKRDSLLEIKEESFKLKQSVDQEIKEKKQELKASEERLLQRENSLDKREELLQKRDNLLNEKEENVNGLQKEIQEKNAKMDNLLKEEMEKLEGIAKFSKEKAHDLIIERVETEMVKEIAELIRDKEAEAKLEIDKKSKNLLVESMQRYANDVTGEQTVSVINLPSDEMKGRLIGREGRNIRTIEAVTGVDLIIDDTPEVIVISSFDPLRREIAKITIEGLIKDGRIHPARIEELYDKVCADMNTKITEIGNQTITELGLSKIAPEIVNLIGKLNFRYSYGQNALQHSKEVAHFAGIMASELGENPTLAKRAGLLHDIGKAVDFEIEGSHVEIGADLAKRYHEDEVVINSILSHHHDHETTSIISSLVEIGDTLSAARPGARNDSLENYVKRLEKLEEIGNSFAGVEKTFAMQAGREVRVMVKPETVDDMSSYKMAKDIKDRIEKELQYPGTIKITVIRETRAQEEAK